MNEKTEHKTEGGGGGISNHGFNENDDNSLWKLIIVVAIAAIASIILSFI